MRDGGAGIIDGRSGAGRGGDGEAVAIGGGESQGLRGFGLRLRGLGRNLRRGREGLGLVAHRLGLGLGAFHDLTRFGGGLLEHLGGLALHLLLHAVAQSRRVGGRCGACVGDDARRLLMRGLEQERAFFVEPTEEPGDLVVGRAPDRRGFEHRARR